MIAEIADQLSIFGVCYSIAVILLEPLVSV
jgi:hypothetical protein